MISPLGEAPKRVNRPVKVVQPELPQTGWPPSQEQEASPAHEAGKSEERLATRGQFESWAK
jgi:hypothetical protein